VQDKVSRFSENAFFLNHVEAICLLQPNAILNAPPVVGAQMLFFFAFSKIDRNNCISLDFWFSAYWSHGREKVAFRIVPRINTGEFITHYFL
jgi:hypothetical protein